MSATSRWCATTICLAVATVGLPSWSAGQKARSATGGPSFALAPCHLQAVNGDGRCGTYWVYENRNLVHGRRIPLLVIVLPARNGHPHADPMFLVSPGGPRTTNSEQGLVIGWNAWWRDDRDVVLVDLRGTSGPNRLDCTLPGSNDHPAGYLETLFPHDAIAQCRDALSKASRRRHSEIRCHTHARRRTHSIRSWRRAHGGMPAIARIPTEGPTSTRSSRACATLPRRSASPTQLPAPTPLSSAGNSSPKRYGS